MKKVFFRIHSAMVLCAGVLFAFVIAGCSDFQNRETASVSFLIDGSMLSALDSSARSVEVASARAATESETYFFPEGYSSDDVAAGYGETHMDGDTKESNAVYLFKDGSYIVTVKKNKPNNVVKTSIEQIGVYTHTGTYTDGVFSMTAQKIRNKETEQMDDVTREYSVTIKEGAFSIKPEESGTELSFSYLGEGEESGESGGDAFKVALCIRGDYTSLAHVSNITQGVTKVVTFNEIPVGSSVSVAALVCKDSDSQFVPSDDFFFGISGKKQIEEGTNSVNLSLTRVEQDEPVFSKKGTSEQLEGTFVFCEYKNGFYTVVHDELGLVSMGTWTQSSYTEEVYRPFETNNLLPAESPVELPLDIGAENFAITSINGVIVMFGSEPSPEPEPEPATIVNYIGKGTRSGDSEQYDVKLHLYENNTYAIENEGKLGVISKGTYSIESDTGLDQKIVLTETECLTSLDGTGTLDKVTGTPQTVNPEEDFRVTSAAGMEFTFEPHNLVQVFSGRADVESYVPVELYLFSDGTYEIMTENDLVSEGVFKVGSTAKEYVFAENAYSTSIDGSGEWKENPEPELQTVTIIGAGTFTLKSLNGVSFEFEQINHEVQTAYFPASYRNKTVSAWYAVSTFESAKYDVTKINSVFLLNDGTMVATTYEITGVGQTIVHETKRIDKEGTYTLTDAGNFDNNTGNAVLGDENYAFTISDGLLAITGVETKFYRQNGTAPIPTQESLTITAESAPAIKVGETVTLSATVTYSNGDKEKNPAGITWNVDKEGIVTVENGVVKAVAAGTANISASLGDMKSDLITVTVSVATAGISVELETISGEDLGAYVELSSKKGDDGTVTLTATPKTAGGTVVTVSSYAWTVTGMADSKIEGEPSVSEAGGSYVIQADDLVPGTYNVLLALTIDGNVYSGSMVLKVRSE